MCVVEIHISDGWYIGFLYEMTPFTDFEESLASVSTTRVLSSDPSVLKVYVGGNTGMTCSVCQVKFIT